MPSKKHYIITSITLGAIAASSAVLIGVTNLITKDKIAKNEKDKISLGISKIFSKNASILDEFAVSVHQYTTYAYEIKNEDNGEACALKTTGSNMYGKISLLVGFTNMVIPGGELKEYVFSGLSIIVNEQTYASTLVEEYIDPLNEGDRDLMDTSCGATYGAKLVKDMVEEAKTVANELFNKE